MFFWRKFPSKIPLIARRYSDSDSERRRKEQQHKETKCKEASLTLHRCRLFIHIQCRVRVGHSNNIALLIRCEFIANIFHETFAKQQKEHKKMRNLCFLIFSSLLLSSIKQSTLINHRCCLQKSIHHSTKNSIEPIDNIITRWDEFCVLQN